MAMAKNDSHLAGLAFKSGALPEDDVRLRGVAGTERLSQLYEFQLILSRQTPYTDDEIDDLLKAPCAISLANKKGAIVHGILRSIEMREAVRENVIGYLATMVPNIWLTTLSRTNRLFQSQSVPEIVTAILTQYGLRKGHDFDIHAWSGSTPREYVVQYEESDWNFIQRWLEHEGYFYWFEHGESGEKLMVAHQNSACPPIAGRSAVPYRERNNLLGAESVLDWRVTQQRIPARVALFDYNYRRPDKRIISQSDVDTKRGFGTIFYYGDHLKDKGEGDLLAKVRAERLLSQRWTIRARCDSPRFRVGHSFELENHPIAEQDGDYLITAIEHRAGFSTESDDELPYRALFEAIPKKVQFRPERVAEWPSIHGVLHAHVDADGSGDYAQIDEQGRYRVHLPFDGVGPKGGGSSRWIRMAQHYSGPGYGSHFPLHKGTEVLVAHVDGDPDRPIIVASVPNPHTQTPSTSANATQSVIHTASGIRIELEDLQG
jgi:type VI secretion system secreted protein VgrG